MAITVDSDLRMKPSSGNATLQLNHCIIEKCYNAGVNGSSELIGSSIFMYKGDSKLNHVQLRSNKTLRVEAQFASMTVGSILFMNNCSITGVKADSSVMLFKCQTVIYV